MSVLRKLKIHLLQFAAFTLGKQIMINEVPVRVRRPKSAKEEYHGLMQAVWEAAQSGDFDTLRATLRVATSLPAPSLDDFDNIFDWEFALMEWTMCKDLARDYLRRCDDDAR